MSPSIALCEKMDDAGKPKNVQELEELLRTNKGLMNNYHKYKNSRGSSRKLHIVLRFKGM